MGACSPRFDCNSFLETFKDEPEITTGWLAHSFSRACKCGERVLSQSRPKTIRLHLLNGTCFPERGRICGRYEAFAGESIRSAQRKLIRRDKRLMRKIGTIYSDAAQLLSGARGGALTCYIEPCLECPVIARARRVLLELAVAQFPQCTIVDNSLFGSCVAGYPCERHGFEARGAEIVDTDGFDFRLHIKALAKSAARVVLAWLPCMNGGKGDPRLRKNFCKRQDFDALRRWLN